MGSPRVTIGMPVYNRARVVGDSIRQVLDQTFRDFEFILCNDGSSDNSSEVIRTFVDGRLTLIETPNQGPPNPLNTILAKAKGEYIIILHDHDFFHPELIEKSVKVLDKYPDAGFVLQGSAWIDEDGKSNYREMLIDLPEHNNGRLAGEKFLSNPANFNSFIHACCMVRRSHFEAVGMNYDVRFGLYADTDLWLRLLLVSNFIYLKEALFKFRTREVNGHFLNNREFEIVDWISKVHLINVNRYFVEEKLNAKFRELVQRKRDRAIQHLTIRYAANKNLELFNKGLQLNKTLTHGNKFYTFALHLINEVNLLKYLFKKGMGGMNLIRSLFKK